MGRRPLRFLHTSDVHLGSHGYHGAATHHRHCVCPLLAVDALAREHGVDGVLVMGDLFDHARVDETLVGKAFGVLDGFPGVTVLIVGNHDVHDDSSLYRRHGHVVSGSHTVFFDELHGTTSELFDGDLVLWGKAMDEHSARYRPLHGVPGRPDADAWYLVLGHGLHIGDDSVDGAGRSSLITAADIMEFDENSQAVDAKARAAYSERFIHGEIYRARPDVKSAIHSHSSEVLPFSLTDTPMVATISTAGFLGSAPTPVFDIRDSEGERNGTLVNTAKIGAAMAKSMGDRSVVLLRGHGMAVAGPDIPTTVFRAVYARLNAQAQLESLRLGKPNGLNAFEAERPVPPERPWELWVARVTGGGKP